MMFLEHRINFMNPMSLSTGVRQSDNKNLRMYSGVAFRTKIPMLHEITTRQIGKGTLEDFYRFIDSI